LGFLGDIFIVSPPFPLPTAFSLGDILIFFGFTWSILWIPHSARNQK
ncbi:MAG: DUF5317 family protein, partial [Chloroflexi bacterium]|nr:DUF5317 family protein [Chloroflexota bacterium]